MMGGQSSLLQFDPGTSTPGAVVLDFGSVGQTLLEGGFVPMPLEGKRPIPKNWSGFWIQPPSGVVYENWIKRYANSNVGICTGEVVAIDIDIDEPKAALDAQSIVFSALGPTDFVRLGRASRRQLFYRLSYVDARQTASWTVGQIELLADGRQSAVFGVHPDTGMPFSWPNRSLLGASLSDLPIVSAEQIAGLRLLFAGGETSAEESLVRPHYTEDFDPQVGERDKYLFWYAKEQAALTDTLDTLLTQVTERNAQFEQPLTPREVSAKAKSAWNLKLKGKLILKGAAAPTILPVPRATMAGLLRKLHPQAAKLLIGLSVNRHSGKEFTIPLQATAEAFGMSKGSLVKGLKQLLALGIVVDTGRVKRVSFQPRPAKLYRFGKPLAALR